MGHLINGTQVEYVRIPHADNSLHLIPAGADEEALVMLSDILPTGHKIGILNGCVKPGNTIAIIGAGPIGMSVLLTLQFYSRAKIYMIDIDDNHLQLAKKFAADTINSRKQDVAKKIMSKTKDGVDVAIEAVGAPPTFWYMRAYYSSRGHIAKIGVHRKSVDLQIQNLWIQNITITMGSANTNTTATLLKTVSSDKIDPNNLRTHHFKLDEILKAYEVL